MQDIIRLYKLYFYKLYGYIPYKLFIIIYYNIIYYYILLFSVSYWLYISYINLFTISMSIIIEIILYAILAIFIFSRLYNAFGKEEGVIIKNKILDIEGRHSLEGDLNNNISNEEKIPKDNLQYVAKENLVQMQQSLNEIKIKDQTFSTDAFIEGAERAFEMIITAYNTSDLTTLKKLLDKNLAENLIEKIKQRDLKKYNYQNILIAVIKKELQELWLEGENIYATVKFVSEQINVVRDSAGQAISGDPNSTNIIEDIWKFKREAKPLNKKWVLYQMS